MTRGAASAEVEKLGRELQSCRSELERTRQTLQSYLYTISHDLRQPLRNVSAFVSLLSRRYRGRLDPDADEFIDFAHRGSQRCLRMLEGMTMMSRIETRGRPMVSTSCDEALDHALRSMGGRLERSKAQVVREDPLPWVRADPDQVVQVFRHLLDNALRFAGEKPPRIRISARRIGESWMIEVADAGIGIASDQHARAFEAFRVLGDESAEHLGLGLPLCRRIVERHGGEMTLDSSPGQGTRIRFTLPCAEPDERGAS